MLIDYSEIEHKKEHENANDALFTKSLACIGLLYVTIRAKWTLYLHY